MDDNQGAKSTSNKWVDWLTDEETNQQKWPQLKQLHFLSVLAWCLFLIVMCSRGCHDWLVMQQLTEVVNKHHGSKTQQASGAEDLNSDETAVADSWAAATVWREINNNAWLLDWDENWHSDHDEGNAGATAGSFRPITPKNCVLHAFAMFPFLVNGNKPNCNSFFNKDQSLTCGTSGCQHVLQVNNAQTKFLLSQLQLKRGKWCNFASQLKEVMAS